MNGLWSARNIKIMVLAVIVTFAVCIFVAVLAAVVVTQYGGGVNLLAATAVPPSETGIRVLPDSGYSGTEITVIGQNWRPGEVVFIRLQSETGEFDEGYAYAGTVVDEAGQFSTSFVYPYDPKWTQGSVAQVVARAEASGIEAVASFRLVPPTVMPTPTQEATATPTPLLMPTTQPGVPTVQPLPTLPPTPLPPPPPEPVITDWRGAYFTNPNLQGQPALIRNDPQINFEWGMGGPASGFPADNFSVQWTRSLNFEQGHYRFYARVDDGVRLWIDNQLVIDQWRDSGPVTYAAEVYLTGGVHSIRMDYYERIGWSLAQLRWERLQASYPDWKGEYFNNPSLNGSPVLVRNDPWIDFNWGSGSPGPNIPSDNFSARWTRTWRFDSGDYRFYLKVDDGARLWVDDQMLIDQWRDGGTTTFMADRRLEGGDHRLRLEYYDRAGNAEVRLWWERIEASFPDWKGEYFNNRSLEGSPVLVRNDPRPDFNWGDGAPAPGVPGDNFSVRWTRNQRFDETGSYRFYARVDDGVRVWVGGDLVIDSWKNGSERVVSGTKWINAGQKYVKVEYYENRGNARITVWWEKESPTATPVPATSTPTLTPSSTAAPVTPTPALPTNTPETPQTPEPTSTAVGPTPPEPTDTPVSPEPTETPTAPVSPETPVPVQPSITLTPEEGPVGASFTVLGAGWPGGQSVTITLTRPQAGPQIQVDPSMSVGSVNASEDGSFAVAVSLPVGQGWETEPELLVVAYTADLSRSAVARYRIVTSPSPTDTAEPGQPTSTPIETPTETPTEASEPTQEPTAEAQPTETATPTPEPSPTTEPTAEPTATPEPTAEPTEELTQVAPTQPILSLIPISGTVGITLTVHGEGWPAGVPVGFTLAAPPVEGVFQLTVPVTDTVQANEQGMFDLALWLPEGLGLEDVPQAWVIGRTQDGQIQVVAPYTVVTITLPMP